MQAGYHHVANQGVDILNLWQAVAAINPLQFRVPAEQARDVVAAAQAMAEQFAVDKMQSRVHKSNSSSATASNGSVSNSNHALAGWSTSHASPTVGQALYGLVIGNASVDSNSSNDACLVGTGQSSNDIPHSSSASSLSAVAASAVADAAKDEVALNVIGSSSIGTDVVNWMQTFDESVLYG
eukprot:jgi/Chrzof1/8584/Cz03g16120.t1